MAMGLDLTVDVGRSLGGRGRGEDSKETSKTGGKQPQGAQNERGSRTC